MKTRVQILVILLSTAFLGILLCIRMILASEVIPLSEYVCSVESDNEIEEKISNKTALPALPEVYINEGELAYDKETNTIYWPVNLDETALEINLRTRDYKPIIAQDNDLKDLKNAIAHGKSFDLYFIGEENYFHSKIVFTGMPVMTITTEVEEKHGRLNTNKKVVYKGSMTLFNPYTSDEQIIVSNCGYHFRGAYSMNYPKKGYRLGLNQAENLLGLRESRSWVLNALYDDAGLVHNKVSLGLWNKIAQTNEVVDEGVSGEYIELVINNEYRGVYLLEESPNKSNFSVGEEDNLYKAADEIKYPTKKKALTEDWAAIKNWESLFYQEEIPNYEEGTSILNMENAVDVEIFCLLESAFDNNLGNMYYVADYQSDGCYQIIKIPWDFNMTFGTADVFDQEQFYIPYDDEMYQKVDNVWTPDMKKLYQSNPAAIGSLLNDRWKELRGAGVITEEAIDAMFDEEYAYVHNSGAYARNYEKWGSISDTWDDNYVYDFVEKRIPFLDEFFEEISEGGVELWTTDTN